MKKKYIALLGLLVLFLITVSVQLIINRDSYNHGTIPTHRAIYNVQGAVKSIKTDNAVLSFTEEGNFDSCTIVNYFERSDFNGDYLQLAVNLEEDGYVWKQSYLFDKQGRLISTTSYEGDYDLDSPQPILWIRSVESYEYKNKRDILPDNVSYKEYRYDNHDEIYKEWTSDIEYGEIDEQGNWLSRTFNDTTESREISYYSADENASAINCETRKFNWTLFWLTLKNLFLQTLVIFAVLVGCVLILGHMIYELFIRKKLPNNLDVKTFQRMREAEGLSYESTEDENRQVIAYTDELYNMWSPVSVEGDVEYRLPLSKKVLKKSEQIIEQAIALKPTDPEAVELLNKCCGAVNDMNKREFTGSKTYLIMTLIIGVAISWISDTWQLFSFLIPSIVIYIMASMKPTFMSVRTELKGGSHGKFMTAIFGGLFGAVATAKTYEVITTYNDGSVTRETDNSETWITLVFAIVVMLMLSMMMLFVALINYLRNYIIYR